MRRRPWVFLLILLLVIPVATAGSRDLLDHDMAGLPLPDPAVLVAGAPAIGDLELQRAMARGVGQHVDRGIVAPQFGTGSEHFDHEWLYGSWQMAALGYGRLAARDAEGRARWIARMEQCLDQLLGEDARAFDRGAWGVDPLATLTPGAPDDRGHAAWLGYTALPLVLHRSLVPDSRYSPTTDAVLAALERRIAAEPSGVPETFPGQRYPVDLAAGVGALLLDARLRGVAHPVADDWVTRVLPRLRDPATGLLHQAVDAEGRPADQPRGSGTMLAAWFLGFGAAGADLYQSGRAALGGSVLGLGMMREYPVGREGRGDIDSGAIVLGYGVSATGFGIGAALQAGDRETAQKLFTTAEAFGGPVTRETPEGPARAYRAGGAIGDAILFAMVAGA